MLWSVPVSPFWKLRGEGNHEMHLRAPLGPPCFSRQHCTCALQSLPSQRRSGSDIPACSCRLRRCSQLPGLLMESGNSRWRLDAWVLTDSLQVGLGGVGGWQDPGGPLSSATELAAPAHDWCSHGLRNEVRHLKKGLCHLPSETQSLKAKELVTSYMWGRTTWALAQKECHLPSEMESEDQRTGYFLYLRQDDLSSNPDGGGQRSAPFSSAQSSWPGAELPAAGAGGVGNHDPQVCLQRACWGWHVTGTWAPRSEAGWGDRYHMTG